MKLPRATIGCLLLVFVTAIRAETALEVSNPWIREAPPTARVLAGYMTLLNHGDTPLILTKVSSPDFESAEFHRTVIEDGMARMLPLKELEVPANGRVDLEPGERHLMLINPARPLHDGDTSLLTIHCADGAVLRVSVPVVRRTGDSGHQHH
ncbi:MAG: copper chaperone PCu(A)C [Gammaproteobacteria bacterium]